MTADALVSVLVIAVFLAVFYGPWQALCADFARQYAFEQRDALFDFAADGHISFNSFEYRDARRSMEAVIRFAHDLTLPRLIYLVLSQPRNRTIRRGVGKFESRLPIEAKGEIGHRLFKTYKAVLAMVIARSLLLLAFLPLVFLLLLAAKCFSLLKEELIRIVKRAGALIQSEANYVGR